MIQYYAMISPGRNRDWGEVILIDSRIGYFVDKAMYYNEDEDNIEAFKEEFNVENWQFLRKELKVKDKSDEHFVVHIHDNWDSIMSDNYFDFKNLDSTLHFNSVTRLIEYVKENNIEVIDDLT